MSTFVVYDSAYGNTAKIAQAIAAAIPGGAAVHRLTDLGPSSLPSLGLLVVGSPTQGGRPTAAMQRWLEAIPFGRLAGTDVAAFDTRLPAAEQGFGLRTLMGIIGYAAPRILKSLVSRGGTAVAPSEGFIVEGKDGPVRTGELERAAKWAQSIAPREQAAA